MLEDEPLVHFIMPPEVDRSLPAQEGAIGDCVLTVPVRDENRHTGVFDRGEQGDAIRAAAKVRSLVDEGLWVLDGSNGGGVDEGVGGVIKVPEVDEGHVDVDVVWPDRFGQVLSISRLVRGGGAVELARSGQKLISVNDGEEHPIRLPILLHIHLRQRDEILRSSNQRGGLDAVVVLKNQFLRILFFVTFFSHRSRTGKGSVRGGRNHEAAGGPAMVTPETEVAEKGGQRPQVSTIARSVHECPGTQRRRGLRSGGRKRGRRGGEGEGG
jgi:hypothetical protein